MSASLRLDLLRCGLAGPGLDGWDKSAPVLRGAVSFSPMPMAKPIASDIPSRERRRHTFTIALAVATAIQALCLDSETDIPAVFACSGGDTDVIDRICCALIQPAHPVSPQQFINSVHNAPAGHWSIAGRNHAPVTSLSAYDASFAAGLLEAAVQIGIGAPKVLMVAYDVPAPQPIWPFRPLTAPFATALLLAAPGLSQAPMARLDLALARDLEETSLDQPDLESLRLGNPAARCLPLLCALARRQPATVALPHVPPQRLAVRLTLC